MNYRERNIARNSLIFGMMFGFLVGVIVTALLWPDYDDGPTLTEMQNEFAAYSMCMESTNCRMTPEDFIDYYDLKYRILQVEEK